jgi:hypothetical protein
LAWRNYNHNTTQKPVIFQFRQEVPLILVDLKNYNEITDQTLYVILDNKQYRTAVTKWQRYQEQRRSWTNRDMQNNTLTTFKRYIRWVEQARWQLINTYIAEMLHNQLGKCD